ncbi:tetratricopeptide repeat protein [Effusibacillus lacus]|uniref:Uncharacterized protein n=1 Tax=Effusibacillus lacus TaxID=1348429 RepID=A0A292YNG2_9BACL|nr:tetratricopeptide repeat protein [Effusibacillus lacus]TCS72008.1 hypothetical protein EDD64_1231 [Effusibacillus lacus]GAX90303.1 hypothetical protein EFBL_1929 [Effusibacillus lacus]
MNIAQEFYQQAIKKISLGNYEKAKRLLESAIHNGEGHSLIYWTLGLIEVSMGYPHKGLERWKSVKPEAIPDIHEKIEHVASFLPKYEEVRRLYNEAVDFAKFKNWKICRSRFFRLMEMASAIPLPADIYYGYYLTLIVSGELQKAASEMANAPAYVRTTPRFNVLETKLKAQLTSDRKVQTGKKRIYYLRIASVMGILLTAGSLGYAVISNSVQEANGIVGEEKKVPDSQSVNEKELNVRLRELEQNYEKQKLETKQLRELFRYAKIDLDDTVLKASLNTYLEGYSLLKKGEPAKASEMFEKSRELHSDSYFADDNLYYLIQAKAKEGKAQEARTLREEFMAKTGQHYLRSPYYDDILLQQAEDLIQQGKKVEALPLLDKIITDFSNEWTAQRARGLRRQL